jgi:hypothetical protein
MTFAWQTVLEGAAMVFGWPLLIVRGTHVLKT